MSPRPPSELVPHQPVPVTRVEEGGARTEEDAVVIEAPLEVRLGERSLLMTMRTPGDDFDLVRGLLFTEGLCPKGHSTPVFGGRHQHLVDQGTS